MMEDVLVILERNRPADATVRRLAPARQSISERVFIAAPTAPIPELRAAPGVAAVLTGAEDPGTLPPLDPAEALFAQAWLSGRQAKQRTGEGLDWDTPPMVPPDPKR